jgi:hypothetical protein
MKTLSELMKKKSFLSSETLVLETLLGHSIIKNIPSSVSQETLKLYEEYDEKKEEIKGNILNIQGLVSEKTKLYHSIAETKDRISSLTGQWPVWYKTLGQVLYAHYSSQYSDIFGVFYSDAAVQEHRLQDAQKAVEDLKAEMEKQGFFTRLVSQVKYISANNTVSSYNLRRDSILEKGGKAVFESGKLSELIAKGLVNTVIERAYQSCLSLQSDISTEEKKVAELTDQESSLQIQLSSLGATGNGDRRIADLEEEKEKLQKEQDSIAQIQGHDFSILYVTIDGDIITDAPEEYRALITEIQRKREELVSISRRIKMLELDAEVSSLVTKISQYENTIAGNEKKIQQYTNQNIDLQVKIEETLNEKHALMAEKTKLELEEGLTVKQISESSQN